MQANRRFLTVDIQTWPYGTLFTLPDGWFHIPSVPLLTDELYVVLGFNSARDFVFYAPATSAFGVAVIDDFSSVTANCYKWFPRKAGEHITADKLLDSRALAALQNGATTRLSPPWMTYPASPFLGRSLIGYKPNHFICYDPEPRKFFALRLRVRDKLSSFAVLPPTTAPVPFPTDFHMRVALQERLSSLSPTRGRRSAITQTEPEDTSTENVTAQSELTTKFGKRTLRDVACFLALAHYPRPDGTAWELCYDVTTHLSLLEQYPDLEDECTIQVLCRTLDDCFEYHFLVTTKSNRRLYDRSVITNTSTSLSWPHYQQHLKDWWPSTPFSSMEFTAYRRII